MKNLLLIIGLFVSLQASSQCLSITGMRSEMSVDGSLMYFEWQATNATMMIFIPVNFTPKYNGQIVAPSMLGFGPCGNGVSPCTSGMLFDSECPAIIQWQVKQYCYDVHQYPNYTPAQLDAAGVPFEITPIQTFTPTCTSPTTQPIIIYYNGHGFPKKPKR